MEAGPGVDKMENDLIESNHKVKTLCETISTLELRLKDIKNELELSNTKNEQLLIENEKLHCTEEDLSKQVYHLKNHNYFVNFLLKINYLWAI